MGWGCSHIAPPFYHLCFTMQSQMFNHVNVTWHCKYSILYTSRAGHEVRTKSAQTNVRTPKMIRHYYIIIILWIYYKIRKLGRNRCVNPENKKYNLKDPTQLYRGQINSIPTSQISYTGAFACIRLNNKSIMLPWCLYNKMLEISLLIHTISHV